MGPFGVDGPQVVEHLLAGGPHVLPHPVSGEVQDARHRWWRHARLPLLLPLLPELDEAALARLRELICAGTTRYGGVTSGRTLASLVLGDALNTPLPVVERAGQYLGFTAADLADVSLSRRLEAGSGLRDWLRANPAAVASVLGGRPGQESR